ncbi:MAG: energy transducer TonB [Bacteroidota bacterium]
MKTNKGKTVTITLSLLLIGLVSLYFYLREENIAVAQRLNTITTPPVDTLKKEKKTNTDTTGNEATGEKKEKRVLMDIIAPVEPPDPYEPYEPVPEPSLEPEPVVDDNNTVFVVAEQMPEFIGGVMAFHTFVAKNIVYPEIAVEMGIEGTVYLGFIVNKDSSISNLKVLKTVDESLSKEAIRVLKLTDKMWKPGKQNGNLVRVEMRIPIKIRLK